MINDQQPTINITQEKEIEWVLKERKKDRK
jgi:hypothetical protein